MHGSVEEVGTHGGRRRLLNAEYENVRQACSLQHPHGILAEWALPWAFDRTETTGGVSSFSEALVRLDRIRPKREPAGSSSDLK
jgi:hypothetical protein